MRNTISLKLLNTLKKSINLLDNNALCKISDYVKSQQSHDGAFVNKNGETDLYYTSFGWMLCYILNISISKTNMKNYIASIDVNELDLIHYSAYMRCKILNKLIAKQSLQILLSSTVTKKIKKISEFKSIPHNDTQSPYTQFIYLSLIEDTGNTMSSENKKSIIQSLKNYKAPEGGYKNTQNLSTASTNATVAATTVIGQIEGYFKNEDIDFLYHQQDEMGGFKATKESPLPDILSTATSLFALSCYSIKPKYNPNDFIEAHWLNSGGFASTITDDTSDVEYTFYGLLALGTSQ
jgi:prenyltransferase beta subunit